MTLFNQYKDIIERATEAVHERKFFAQYPEHHKAYGETAIKDGKAAYERMLGKNFEELLQGKDEACWIGEEVSPYTGEALNVKYPALNSKAYIERAAAAMQAWKKTPVELRAGILVDALERIKGRFFEMAFATMHTTGQSFMMAFQASGPHSNDRALEALAMAYSELTRFPAETEWIKPMGKFDIKLEKTFRPVPKGINLAIGVSTFPVWNSVPGVFAGMMTGNAVIVKPHPAAILPVAIVVAEIQEALKEAGQDVHVIQLAVDTPTKQITRELAENDQVKLIDYTGGNEFGEYIEKLKGKEVFTEKAGVNNVILDSVSSLDSVLQNLAFSFCLYSGQMCTAPQNVFIPEAGVKEGGKRIEYEEVVQRLKQAVEDLAGNPKMGPGTLAAIQNPATIERVESAEHLGGELILKQKEIDNPDFENARTCTPAIVQVRPEDKHAYAKEVFGPLIFIVKTKDTGQSIELAKEAVMEKGAITCLAYTTDELTEARIKEAMEEAFVPVTFNLTGYIWVNQHAAFSDFHVTGGNAAGNASFTSPAFVNRRFVWVGHRKMKA